MRRLPLRSPPRMRGKDAGCLVHHKKHRITPAYAGKRCLGHLFQVELRDPPRVCGEKTITTTLPWGASGSPPRMRGKGTAPPGAVLHLRITPAYAGKSRNLNGFVADQWDHPRVCGEKNIVARASFDPVGSPPRVRGKGTDEGRARQWLRITPACAGKSSALRNAYSDG